MRITAIIMLLIKYIAPSEQLQYRVFALMKFYAGTYISRNQHYVRIFKYLMSVSAVNFA